MDSKLEIGLAQASVVGGGKAPPRVQPPPLPQTPQAAPAVSIRTEPTDDRPTSDRPATWLWKSWFTLPSWLVSMIVHLIAMISLSLATWPEKGDLGPHMLTVEISDGEKLDGPTELWLKPPGEDDQQAASAAASSISEMLSDADYSSVADLLPSAAEETASDSPASDIGSIDDLLGSGGQGLEHTFGGGKSGAEFFGVKAGGRKFVFIVDSSNSMRGRRFRDAKREVLQAVRRLDKTQSFYVIFFDEDADRMFSGPGQEPEPRPLPATSENIRRLEKWVPTVELEFRTDPYDAVKHAVEMRPDAIYLLSDGQFTDGGRTEEYLAANNLWNDPELGYQPRVVIHTIAFHSREGEPTMQAIAKKYGGTYRFVPSSK